MPRQASHVSLSELAQKLRRQVDTMLSRDAISVLDATRLSLALERLDKRRREKIKLKATPAWQAKLEREAAAMQATLDMRDDIMRRIDTLREAGVFAPDPATARRLDRLRE